METQDDSIDIVRLQRVALGLEPIISQPFLEKTGKTENTPLHHGHHQNTHGDYLLHEVEAEGRKHNATRVPDLTRLSPERTTITPSIGLPAAKMGPADTLPSDTQVISQSVYDEVLRRNKEGRYDGHHSNVDPATLMTLNEGDSGHIDLLSGFDGPHIQIPNTDENDDQSSSRAGDSSPLVYEPNLFPESQRFVAKTPVTATKQHHVEAVATVSPPFVSRNPLASDLESGSGFMALSQVFKATQAPSSPLVNGLQSDLMSDRPSPNIPIQHRPLAPSLSSPFNTLAAIFPRELSETQLNYITMKESQANRDNIIKERMTRSADHIYSGDHSDSEFHKEPSLIERTRRQRRIDEKATAQFATLSAPARQPSHLESETGHRAISVSGAPERRVWIGGSTRAALEESHGPTVELQPVGISEEETEQEEELLEMISRSQVPNFPTEEDKENCNGPSTVGLSQAASSHDRLSQALSSHDSPLPDNRRTAQSVSDTHLDPRGQDLDDDAIVVVRSSPITVVKDSQRNGEEQVEEKTVKGPRKGSKAPQHGSQPQSKPADALERCSFSPDKQTLPQLTTQGSQQYSEKFHTAPVAPLPLTSSARSSCPFGSGSPGQPVNIARVRDSTDPDAPGIGSRAPALDSRGKSSSIPSRVAETPVHRRQRSSNGLLPFAAIPETSPSGINTVGWMSDGNNEAAEDDDLPPPFPRAIERTNQSQSIILDSSSPIKHLLNSKILSSPSGRQRRALTEIAADASPQLGSTLDVAINILSADDQEFRSAVAMSPIPPCKKRRGNGGRTIPASDPILPVTPRAKPHLTHLQEVEEAEIAEPPQPIEPASRRQSTFPRRTHPSPRRSGSIWDTEDSPKFRVSSKERSKIFARSLARERQVSEQQEPQQDKIAPPQAPQPVSLESPWAVTSTSVPDIPGSDPAVEASPAVEEQQLSSENIIIAPNQVIAIWRGQKRAYYPATCFGRPFGNSQDAYLIKFEDSSLFEVPIGTVKRLELRIGDAIKIDMPNVPKVTHIVRGFTDKLNVEELSSEATKGVIPVTDVYGHATVVLGPKQRKSLPSGGLSAPESFIHVPISRIYLDTILWNQLKDRTFAYNYGSGTSESRLQTPSDRHPTPSSPNTRLSRSFRLSNGLFSGMIFAVSYGDKSDSKCRVTKMILENDGRIMEDGFNELFDLPLNAPLATLTKSPTTSLKQDQHLRLRSGVEDAGFACLIADKHSRRPKYMQALALNLPCLSDRWIKDCVARGQVLDWEMYLLPSGESSYLAGATKSRILTPYPATRARLYETVAARPNLLKGQSVLLITGRNGKADEERRRAYIFLTYALGASKIERVPDVQSARAILKQSQSGEEASTWDWIYVDDDGKAAKFLAAGSSGAASKNRRKSRLMDSVNGDDLGVNSNVRVVGNEFVCQSLILGRLVDV